MFSVLKYRKDKRKLLEYTKEQKESLDKLDYESLQAMAVLLKTPQLLAKVNEKEGTEGNMCQALEEYYQDGVQEGIEKGILQGIEQGIEMIAEFSGLSEKEVQSLCVEL